MIPPGQRGGGLTVLGHQQNAQESWSLDTALKSGPRAPAAALPCKSIRDASLVHWEDLWHLLGHAAANRNGCGAVLPKKPDGQGCSHDVGIADNHHLGLRTVV